MSTHTQLQTADELLKLPSSRRCELVNGELREMSPSGFEHGAVTLNLGHLIRTHVKANSLGVAVGAETGFLLRRNPDTVRAPDVGFVKTSRIPASGRPVGFWEGAPDLAVEVVSPSDTITEVDEKVDDYLSNGTSMVWIVNFQRRTVTVHRANANPIILREKDFLDGFDLLPGFRCPVSEIFS